MSSTNVNEILYLFDRPSQPIFAPKGENSDVRFSVPSNFYNDRYRPIAESLSSSLETRFPSGTQIPVQTTTITDEDIRSCMLLDRKSLFSLFNPFHRECATTLINTLMAQSSLQQFKSACVYIQPRVNPYLYVYALSVATLHRTDTRGLALPSHACMFPELYVDGSVLTRAREEGTTVQNQQNRQPIVIQRDTTASDLDPEHRLWYFREDIGINLHHWHWHLVYPFDGPMNIVNKNRRGELFYYMHEQIMARYNFERLSNNLYRVASYGNFRVPLKDGYFPKLDSLVASRVWPPRQANQTLTDLNRESDQLSVGIADMDRWRDRILEAAQRGFVYRGTEVVQLSITEGIDVLGNIVEASILSINPNLYGNMHNQGHNIIAYCHDPDNRYLENFGVIGDPTTAMRDPAFYSFHSFINDIFLAHKHTLPGYTTQELGFNGVNITSISFVTTGMTQNNVFQTFWQTSQLDLSRGLDFSPRGPIFAQFSHLQHVPFTYSIVVNNTGQQRQGTVRIFMAPKYDERGVPFRFRYQKTLFIELDRFVVNLNRGTQTITRRSSESSITIPFEQTFRSLDVPTAGTAAETTFNFCGCGWPDHALIPKGTYDGLPCELFVMISDYANDSVQNTSTSSSTGNCKDASSFCGVRDRNYPDRRAMGFPFDRNARSGVGSLSQFITPNMRVQDVFIRFTDRVITEYSNDALRQVRTSTAGTGTATPAATTTAATGQNTARPSTGNRRN